MAAIYTCTMNLAIDLFIETDELKPNTVNRSIDDDIQANGKGVNVSLILKQLGVTSTALGFSGGFTGSYIDEFLVDKKIQTDFIHVNGMTRINVFTQVNHPKSEYKLVNKGPVISQDQISQLLQQISDIPEGSYLCISGSLPQGVTPQIFEQISEIAERNQVHLILDTSYKEVLDCLKYKPFLLKPNEDELAEWFGKEALSVQECIVYGQELVRQGAEHVLVSLGGEGGLYITADSVLYGNAPKGEVVNTACAGDTLLGSFVGNQLQGKQSEDNLKYSLAAASSTAFRKGLTDFSDVEELSRQIDIQRL
ncbi:1-phosphofructokinase [Enterococcus sp. BWB1-3]|uniref:1-phosphofructokinase n=1 Tax=unclassified Enterococcus TaxID=2608891 RepID=UPI001920D1F4|nr:MULTISPECIES: 1-phosphofructokinase [unclassified Enterococcus]MBL1229866.1 1-phosphofructokinase [Enterococcus sp. BWB1-3]MCB5954940.1 1-phosphofructokinase [Enterococcus sp. CWB-B31]